jgi:hypothetical protein
VLEDVLEESEVCWLAVVLLAPPVQAAITATEDTAIIATSKRANAAKAKPDLFIACKKESSGYNPNQQNNFKEIATAETEPFKTRSDQFACHLRAEAR